MYKVATNFKLPKIEETTSHKSQSSFTFAKEQFPGPLKAFKEDKKPGNSGLVNFNSDSYGFGGASRRGFSTDKLQFFDKSREDSIFPNSSMKQTWLLKKLEEQREALHKKSQNSPYKENPPSGLNKQTGKAAHLNHLLNSMTPYQSEKELGQAKGKFNIDEDPISKSLNFGSAKRSGRPDQLSLNERKNSKLEVDIGTESLSASPQFNISQDKNRRSLMKPLSKTPSTLKDKLKFPVIGTNEDLDLEKGDSVRLDLFFVIEEKIRGIFENQDDKEKLLPFIKDYLELVNREEVLHIESLFFDTRMRRNLKTYMMLERTAMFTLLSVINEDATNKETQDAGLTNISHYIWNNFLNFADILLIKLEFLPRFNQTPNLEKLRQIVKTKNQEQDRSFGLEQVNKLLLKALRTTLKQSLAKKGERYPKSDLLLEKIEFGLMLNYFDELKTIFYDLIVKHNINILSTREPEITEPLTAKKRPSKPEKPRPSARVNGTLSVFESLAMKDKAPEKEAHLPPIVPKPGEEHKPVYSLVLDMDETLIHFEEVGGKGRFFVRPFAEKFLKEMSEYYEITIFTAGVKEYADAVLNILDPNGYISHRLYRHHTTIKSTLQGIIKDLSKLGRDLSKTLIIDNAPENFRLQKDNGIEITSWYNDPYDTELQDMMPFLKELVLRQVDDVRKSIKKWKEKKKPKRNF